MWKAVLGSMLAATVFDITVAKKLPSFIKICQRSDPDLHRCMLDNGELLKPSLKQGIPELFIPSLDPLVIPEASLNSADSFKATFQNIQIPHFVLAKRFTASSLSTFKPQKSVYLLDDTDSYEVNQISHSINKYTYRTHTCGELSTKNVGEKVVLCGWLQHQRMNKFAVLRDSYGETQLLITDEHLRIQKILQETPYETIIQVKGTVLKRPTEMVNTKQKTGDIEVQVESFEILNKAKDILPFNIREFQKANESLRMQYRYLDIRFPQMQRNLRIRSKLLMKMREFLIDNHFVDVQVESFEILNKAKDILPFNIREFQKANESLRMQYRYLDIRFPQMQRNLRIRSKLLMKMREFLIDNHFVDVETPTLFKATPGGPQEFIVPTRSPAKFYSLVQSPQQFKQMLMAGALDRYFQIAKCYRDEGSRSDWQQEFTQLDIELSFTNIESIIKLIEELLFNALAEFYDGVPRRFKRISYEEALETYGSDKPDITFGYKIQNCTELLKGNENLNAVDDFGAYILVFDPKTLRDLGTLTRSVKEKMAKVASSHPKAKLIQNKVLKKDWANKMSKLLSNQEAENILKEFNVSDNSVLFMTYGSKNDARNLLGKIRLEYVQFLEQNSQIEFRKKGLHFLWVVDFPLFEINVKTGALQSAHHPFTAPHPDDLDLLDTDPLKVRASAYDLVLNGNEIGGGSIRIHNPTLQEKILNLLNIKSETLQHIIDMLGSGCPPHGGIALGLDRILKILLNMSSIRDVIAFPKTVEGRDPVSHSPFEVSEETLQLYHIRTVTDKNK